MELTHYLSLLIYIAAEESGGGKVLLLERGAYEDMDLCIMCVAMSFSNSEECGG